MPDFFYSIGASSPAIVDVLTAAGSPLDLTGATVTVVINKYGKSFVSAGTATVLNAVGGEVSYSPGTGTLTEAGYYQFRWKIVWPNSGGTQYIPSDRYKTIRVEE